jgi:multiphosphoryl transfer protein
MVGIVLVSHSRPLAVAAQELVRAMTGPGLPLAIAAGAGENHAELGTDAVEISEAILSVKGPEGVLVLMDMGSAILSSETALDLMEEKDRQNIRFCAAPFVEGAVAAGVTSNLGASLDQVHDEALAALKQKRGALAVEKNVPLPPSASTEAAGTAKNQAPRKNVHLVVRNPHGLHARPAARLIRETGSFPGEITVRNLTNGRGPVSIKSLSSLAGLEILQGHEIEVSAAGDDADKALKKITELIQTGLGDAALEDRPKTPSPAPTPATKTGPTPISEGLAVGRGFYFTDVAFDIPKNKIDDVPHEIERLQTAVAAAQKELEAHRAEMSARVGAASAEIYGAQILALQDPELIGTAIRMISDERKNAALAWSEANRQIVNRYAALRDSYLRERAADVEDAGRLVLERLAVKKTGGTAMTAASIVIANDLTPQQVSGLHNDRVLGVILLDGGPTAHSSILLKALGLPAIVQARSVFAGYDLNEPGLMAFDGATGEIWLKPKPDFLEELKKRQIEQRKQACREKEASAEPGSTLDGHRVQIFANIGHVAEAAEAVPSGAEGVGLLRTEFLFLNRKTAPTEDEQIEALREIASQLGNRPVIVRTLDVGGDKEVPYLKMAAESNPFLGVRALRLCFSREELFATQLRAILRAGHGRDMRIMFPMVADVSDLERARACLEKAHRGLEQENVPHLWPVPVGIMIEIPSAALQAEALAEEAEFFSIGTNDLTQYTLAADRGNPALAPYQDAAHPAVLRLVDLIVRGARKRGRLAAVCGEAASDEIAALLFVGLGVEELSATGAKIPRLKTMLRRNKLETLQELARHALDCTSAAEVRRLAHKWGCV